jgi:hypothetical protein
MLLNPEDVAGPLYDLITDAVQHLRAAVPDSARLESLQAGLQELPNPSQHEIRLRWLAGLPAPARVVDQLKGKSADQFKGPGRM